MLAVILFISAECFYISYHPFRALVKTADFVDAVIVDSAFKDLRQLRIIKSNFQRCDN